MLLVLVGVAVALLLVARLLPFISFDADNDGKIAEKGYGVLIAEKRDYLFRNQKTANKKTVLFPGCNFPSFSRKPRSIL